MYPNAGDEPISAALTVAAKRPDYSFSGAYFADPFCFRWITQTCTRGDQHLPTHRFLGGRLCVTRYIQGGDTSSHCAKSAVLTTSKAHLANEEKSYRANNLPQFTIACVFTNDRSCSKTSRCMDNYQMRITHHLFAPLSRLRSPTRWGSASRHP